MSFELKVVERIPGKLAINYEELKREIDISLNKYRGLVVTEDEIIGAKRDRATLNKVKEVIEGRRKELKKEFLEPYEEVERQAKELVGMIDEVNSEIDKQIKEFEEKEKEDKKIEIANLWVGLSYNKITVDKIWNNRWLNKTFTFAAIEEEMKTRILGIEDDLAAIKGLCGNDEQKCLTLQSKYLRTLDFKQIVTEYNEEQEAAEKIIAARGTVVEPKRPAFIKRESDETEEEKEDLYEIKFVVIGTEKQITALSVFLVENNINFKVLKGE